MCCADNNPNAPIMPYFAVFMSLWSTLLLEYWSRKEKLYVIDLRLSSCDCGSRQPCHEVGNGGLRRRGTAAVRASDTLPLPLVSRDTDRSSMAIHCLRRWMERSSCISLGAWSETQRSLAS